MIYAYAIEPEFAARLGERANYNLFYNNIGVGTSRVMVSITREYREWRDRVKAIAEENGCRELEMRRLVNLIKNFGSGKVVYESYTYDDSITWLENAETLFDRVNYRSIIASDNPRTHIGVVDGNELKPDDTCWEAPTSILSALVSEAIADYLKPILSVCSKIRIIDPYCDTNRIDCRFFVEVLLNRMLNDRHIPLPEIEIHSGTNRKSAIDVFEQEAQRWSAHLYNGINVSFFRWSELPRGARLHNRYILTNIGGVKVGESFNQDSPDAKDELQLLDRESYNYRWQLFNRPSTGYTLDNEPSPISGTKSKRQHMQVASR